MYFAPENKFGVRQQMKTKGKNILRQREEKYVCKMKAMNNNKVMNFELTVKT